MPAAWEWDRHRTSTRLYSHQERSETIKNISSFWPAAWEVMPILASLCFQAVRDRIRMANGLSIFPALMVTVFTGIRSVSGQSLILRARVTCVLLRLRA